MAIVDPAFEIVRSGALVAQEEAKLDERKGLLVGTGQTEFPDLDIEVDGAWYRLTDVEWTTDTTGAQLTLEFQTRAACLLRELLGPLKATRAANLTRAEFLAAVMAKVKSYGGVAFYCPLLEVIQPVGKAKTTHSGSAPLTRHPPKNPKR